MSPNIPMDKTLPVMINRGNDAMRQAGQSDFISALDTLISQWEAPVLEHWNGGNPDVPNDVPMKNPDVSRHLEPNWNIGTLKQTRDIESSGTKNIQCNMISDVPVNHSISPENRVPTFQTFQNRQKDVSEQEVSVWNIGRNGTEARSKCSKMPDEGRSNPEDPAGARPDAAECGLTPEGSGDIQNQNAASPACRSGFPAPAWVLRQDERPDGDRVEDWREWMRDRYRHKAATGNFADKRNILLSVWGEAERAYHYLKGMVPHPHSCAGCGAALTSHDRVIVIRDGARVHSIDECVDAYGDLWRSEAKAALVAMGLNPPTLPAPDALK